MDQVYSAFFHFFPHTLRGTELILLILAGAACVLMFWAWCRLFAKMGLPWERMFVPGYGYYWTYESVESGGLFAAKVMVDVMAVFSVYYMGARWPLLLLVFGLIPAALVIRALYLRRVAEAFGRGIGFTVGLFFLRPVFLAILAFGPAPYYGDSGSPTGQIVPATSWICPVCHTANPMHRDSCENCGRRAGIE